MKVLAISDRWIPTESMHKGLSTLASLGWEVTIRQWHHDSSEDLQRDNLLIELHGPDAVQLQSNLYADIDLFDAVILQFAPLPAEVIQRAVNLKWIGVLRGGVENVALPTATHQNVVVLNTPGRNARAVAEFTIGLILSEVRNIARSHAALKSGEWRKDFANQDNIPELCGKTAGLVGLGNIGLLVAHYLLAFGCRIVAYDPFVSKLDLPIELLDLEELLQQSDFVSVHARYSQETHHMISAKQIGCMKANAVLVNTARSGLVDQNALIDALRQRRIAGAALDVFDVEPIPPDHDILKLDNLTMTSHLAGSTRDAFTGSPKLFADRLLATLQAGNSLTGVNGLKWGVRV